MDFYDIPGQFCPKCDVMLSVVSLVNAGEYEPPEGGDLIVCHSCATILIFDDDVQLVDNPPLVAQIMADMSIESPEEALAIQAARQIVLRGKIDA